jgi:hypothetical protein
MHLISLDLTCLISEVKILSLSKTKMEIDLGVPSLL